ncbi:MAG TPA: hypothetical protein VHE53_04690 [Patescibacteria group bacterium]|nr:hypothetical protein [Patescibacteria group bacterium]
MAVKLKYSKFLISLVLSTLALMLSNRSSFGESSIITTGNAESYSNVTTQTNNGSSTTHIEVEANGEKKVIDSSDTSGSYTVSVKSNNNGSQASSSVEVNNKSNLNQIDNPSPSASPSGIDKHYKAQIYQKIQSKNIFESISNFLKNLFKAL